MFADVQGLLFHEDGVSADLVRAGEPRLRRHRGRDTSPALVTSPARSQAPLLRRLARPLSP
ncbi:MAG: hypothetical protein WD794_14885 [Mycobacteriales bacterium]